MAFNNVNEDALSYLKMLGSEKSVPECRKQRHNLNLIIHNSNATPFRDRTFNGYLCAFCPKAYEDPGELRAHTHRKHQKELIKYKEDFSLGNHVVFLDINGLKCTLCDHELADIKVLVEHLVDIHDKVFYKNIADYIQPFKLNAGRTLACCICRKSYNNFKMLNQHMNEHYRNFICSICGIGFVNKYRLIRHIATHSKPPRKLITCRHCQLDFESEFKRRKHENLVHLHVPGYNKCQVCGERFPNYYQKSRHMVDRHKVEKFKCNACDRDFVARTLLMIHVRRDHLMERMYQCKICKHGFFQKARLDEHYVVHTKERTYKCEICDKCFSRKRNLTAHMKIHSKPSVK